ncbi:MAG: hypothetical protein ACE5MB_02870 [Anaerolineae bacterium]
MTLTFLLWFTFFHIVASSRLPADSSWSPNIRVNDDPGTARQWLPAIAVDGSGNAYAIWQDERSGEWMMDVYFAHRPASEQWGSNKKVNDDAGTAWQLAPAIAVDAFGNAYAVWADSRNGDLDIYFAYRPLGGSWGPNEKVNDDGGRAHQEWPDIAVDGYGNACAVWVDRRHDNKDIYRACRPAGGSWGPNERVNDDSRGAEQDRPAIAMNASGQVCVVWMDRRNGDPDIYSACNWGPNEKVNDDSGVADQDWPDIAVDGFGNAYAIWVDGRNGDEDIFFAHRPAGGSWGPSKEVDDDSGTAVQETPVIAVDVFGNACAVWMDRRHGDQDIYFARRPVGKDWERNERVNDDSGVADQDWPAIAVDGSGNAYAVWVDRRRGDEDIFFAYRRAGVYLHLPLILRNF